MKNLFLIFATMTLFSFASLAVNSDFSFSAEIENADVFQQQQQDQQGQQQRQQRQDQQDQQRSDSEEIDTDELPQAIQNKVRNEHRGADIESAHKEVTKDGETVYKVKLETPDRGEVTKKFHSDGREYEEGTQKMQREGQPQRDDDEEEIQHEKRGPNAQQQQPTRQQQQAEKQRTDSEEIETDELPQAIQNRVRNDFQDADIESAHRELTEDGEMVYKVKLGNTDKGEVTKTFRADGREYEKGDARKGMQRDQQRRDQDDDLQRDDPQERGPNAQQQQPQQDRTRGMQQGKQGDTDEIETDELPQAIQNRVRADFEDADIESAYREVTEDGEMVYKVKLDTPDKGEVTKTFRADGREYEKGDAKKGMQPGQQHRDRDDDMQPGELHQQHHNQDDATRGMQQTGRQLQGKERHSEEIETDELPQAIQTRVRNDYKDAELESAHREVTEDGEMIYKVKLNTTDKGEVTKSFRIDGREFEEGDNQKGMKRDQQNRDRDDDMHRDDDQRGPSMQQQSPQPPPAPRAGTREQQEQQRRAQTEGTRQIDRALFGQPEEINEDELPQPVRHRIKREYKDADIDSAEWELVDEGEVIYKVNIDTEDRGQLTRRFHSDGREYDATRTGIDRERYNQRRDPQQRQDSDTDDRWQRQQREQSEDDDTGIIGRIDHAIFGDPEEINENDLPMPVRHRIKREYKDADVESAEFELVEDGEVIYHVKIDTEDRGEVTKRFHADGREYEDSGMQRDNMRQRDDDRWQRDDQQQRGPNAQAQQQTPRSTQQEQQRMQQEQQRRTQQEQQRATTTPGQFDRALMGQGEDIEEDELPQPVRHRIKMEFRDADIESAQFELGEDGEVIYNVKIETDDRGEVSKRFRSDGREFDANQSEMQLDDQQRYQRGQDSPRGTTTPGGRLHQDPNQQQQDRQQQQREGLDQDPQQQQQGAVQRRMGGDSETINVNQLPEAIQNRIQREHRGSTIESAERRVMPNGEMVYEVNMTTPDKGEVSKKFHSDGREYEDN